MKYLLTVVSFLAFAWFAMWWFYSCGWCTTENRTAMAAALGSDSNDMISATTNADNLELANSKATGFYATNASGEDVFRYAKQIKINAQHGTVEIPEALQSFGDKIADYLGANQGQELLISGWQTQLEKEQGDTLGINRAAFIENLLIDKGINADRILTQSITNSYAYNNQGEYLGGIGLEFKPLTAAHRMVVEQGISNKILYSKFGIKDFKPDPTLENYALELKSYLQTYPDKIVHIIGHTDDIGTKSDNQTFGYRRAENVQSYLESQGIDAAKLEIDSKGELEPIVPNISSENRAKNRRIEIKVN